MESRNNNENKKEVSTLTSSPDSRKNNNTDEWIQRNKILMPQDSFNTTGLAAVTPTASSADKSSATSTTSENKWFTWQKTALLHPGLFNETGIVAVTPTASSADKSSATSTSMRLGDKTLRVHKYAESSKKSILPQEKNKNANRTLAKNPPLAIFNPQRRAEIYLPYSFFDGKETIGLYMNSSLSKDRAISKELMNTDLLIESAHTAGCFLPNLKGVDQYEGTFTLIKHELKFRGDQKFTSIEYNPKEKNPYEELHFSELKILASFLDQFSARQEILLISRLPDFDQSLKATIMTPQGLFQRDEEKKEYQLILNPDLLEKIKLTSYLTQAKELTKEKVLILSHKKFSKLNNLVIENKGNTLIDTTKPIKLLYHLPYYDYMLFGIKLFIRDRITPEALSDFFIKIINKKKSHEEKIRAIFKEHNIDVTIESPFENLFGPLEKLFSNSEFSLDEILDTSNPPENDLSVAQVILKKLGYSLELNNIPDSNQTSADKEQDLVQRCLEVLKNNSHHEVQQEIWRDFLAPISANEITTLEDLMKIANAVAVGVSTKKNKSGKTISFLPVPEHQIHLAYDKLSAAFNKVLAENTAENAASKTAVTMSAVKQAGNMSSTLPEKAKEPLEEKLCATQPNPRCLKQIQMLMSKLQKTESLLLPRSKAEIKKTEDVKKHPYPEIVRITTIPSIVASAKDNCAHGNLFYLNNTTCSKRITKMIKNDLPTIQHNMSFFERNKSPKKFNEIFKNNSLKK